MTFPGQLCSCAAFAHTMSPTDTDAASSGCGFREESAGPPVHTSRVWLPIRRLPTWNGIETVNEEGQELEKM